MPRRSTVVGEIGGLGEPRYTAMHPTERIAYVSESKRGAVAVIDLVAAPDRRAGSTFQVRRATSR